MQMKMKQQATCVVCFAVVCVYTATDSIIYILLCQLCLEIVAAKHLVATHLKLQLSVKATTGQWCHAHENQGKWQEFICTIAMHHAAHACQAHPATAAAGWPASQ